MEDQNVEDLLFVIAVYTEEIYVYAVAAPDMEKAGEVALEQHKELETAPARVDRDLSFELTCAGNGERTYSVQLVK